jgi:hypothetical protein
MTYIIAKHNFMRATMMSSNGTLSHCKSKVEHKVMGSKPIRYVYNLPIKKRKNTIS